MIPYERYVIPGTLLDVVIDLDVFQRLSQHFRRLVLHSPEGKLDSSSLSTPLLATIINANVPKAPAKSNYINQYMLMYYPTLMKEEADKRVAAQMLEYNALAPEDRPEKEPCSLSIRKQVAVDFWQTETPDVRQAVLKEAVRSHEEGMVEWEKLKEIPKTAEQYHQ